MAYYAALVSTVQLINDISLSEHQYPNSLFEKQQIMPLYEKLSYLQELLEDYSPNDNEAAGFLDRIRDAACLAQDLIECRIPDAASREKVLILGHDDPPIGSYPAKQTIKFRVPYAAYQAKCIIESQGRRRDCLEEIIHGIFRHFVSACHNSEHMDEAVVFTVRKGYQDLWKCTEQLGSVVREGYLGLENMIEVDSINMGKGYLDLMKFKEELDPIVVNGYQDLVKLKEELDAVVGYQDLEMVKKVVDSIVGRGYQFFERVKEKVESIVGKGGNHLLAMVEIDVDSIVEDLKRIKKCHTTHQDDLQVGVGVSTQGPNDGNTMVGFEEHLMTILGQLCGESSRLEVISIVGMGGIGKTTLARNIFENKLIGEQFYIRIWVSVSQSYNSRNILLTIANSLNINNETSQKKKKRNINNEELHGVEDWVLRQHIYQSLYGRRYLIIMDDVWDRKVWDEVKWIFPSGVDGSRIIITTRQSDVASLANASEFVNQIPTLTLHQSWTLFCEKVLCPPELEYIGRSIVQNCRGLPLAIVVVAGLLSKVSKTRYNWKEIARGVRSTVAKNDEHFTKILSLSYNYLSHHLKPCFLYFGGFPEDYKVKVSTLVQLWVAEGFLKPIAYKSLEEVGEEYLEELVKRNLVLITKWSSNGKFKYCSIHDLLRDLYSERARHEHSLQLLHNKHIGTGHMHRFFIHPGSLSEISMQEKDFLHVRSIVSFSSMPSYFSSHPSNFKPLRVLNARIDLSPDGIFELLHLRYLVLSCREPDLPRSIFKLQNLQTLIVDSYGQFSTISLPSEIWKMPQLRHVMVHRVILPPIPDDVRIRNGVPLLRMLQTLSTVEDFIFDCTTVDMIPNLKKLKIVTTEENYEVMNGLKNLVDLRQLETLDIYISKWFSPFPSNFSFPMNLKKLNLRGCHLPWKDLTIAGSLPNLQILKLRWKSFFGREWEPIEGEFPKLKYLLLESLYDLEHWGAENTHFPCLEQLHIRWCRKLEIPSGVGDIPTLQLIELRYCSRYVESRALEIQREQQEYGNNDLQVRCIRTSRWEDD